MEKTSTRITPLSKFIKDNGISYKMLKSLTGHSRYIIWRVSSGRSPLTPSMKIGLYNAFTSIFPIQSSEICQMLKEQEEITFQEKSIPLV